MLKSESHSEDSVAIMSIPSNHFNLRKMCWTFTHGLEELFESKVVHTNKKWTYFVTRHNKRETSCCFCEEYKGFYLRKLSEDTENSSEPQTWHYFHIRNKKLCYAYSCTATWTTGSFQRGSWKTGAAYMLKSHIGEVVVTNETLVEAPPDYTEEKPSTEVSAPVLD